MGNDTLNQYFKEQLEDKISIACLFMEYEYASRETDVVENIFPRGWYDISANSRIEILAEAMEGKKPIRDTEKWQPFIEGVRIPTKK